MSPEPLGGFGFRGGCTVWTMSWKCVACGAQHDDLPLSYRTGPPVIWATLVPAARERSVLDDEICVVRQLAGEDAYFIRGNVEIPVLDGTAPIFIWTVWCSLSQDNFKATLAVWDKPGRESTSPMFGWFSSELVPPYPSTLNLPTNVRTRPVGQRPTVELAPSEHPLAVEQRKGITMRRVEEIASAVLHQ
jgi:hypothetical protein